MAEDNIICQRADWKTFNTRLFVKIFWVWPLTFETQKLCIQLISIWGEQHSFVLLQTTKLFWSEFSVLQAQYCVDTISTSRSSIWISSLDDIIWSSFCSFLYSQTGYWRFSYLLWRHSCSKKSSSREGKWTFLALFHQIHIHWLNEYTQLQKNKPKKC